MSTDKRDIQENASMGPREGSTKGLSPWARYWARQRRTPQDSHLVSFGQRVTYTFAVGHDVASVHFDMERGELFYKGHRITAQNMEPWLVELLNHFKEVLSASEYADKFLESYSLEMDKMLHP